jgi:hypothetical protein
MGRAVGLVAAAVIVCGAIAACMPSGDTGYVEIKTVPAAPVTQTALYLGSEKLAPIKKGSTVLRERVGTLKLQTDGFVGSLTAICDIEVKKNRITTVTVSVLDRPPRCQCRFGGAADAAGHACVS